MLANMQSAFYFDELRGKQWIKKIKMLKRLQQIKINAAQFCVTISIGTEQSAPIPIRIE